MMPLKFYHDPVDSYFITKFFLMGLKRKILTSPFEIKILTNKVFEKSQEKSSCIYGG